MKIFETIIILITFSHNTALVKTRIEALRWQGSLSLSGRPVSRFLLFYACQKKFSNSCFRVLNGPIGKIDLTKLVPALYNGRRHHQDFALEVLPLAQPRTSPVFGQVGRLNAYENDSC